MRGTTGSAGRHGDISHISIHVPREGDDGAVAKSDVLTAEISIHVPREGDDAGFEQRLCAVEISIHVPREGDDRLVKAWGFRRVLFQSTSPVRGTTPHHRFHTVPLLISIHVPREGDDRPWI